MRIITLLVSLILLPACGGGGGGGSFTPDDLTNKSTLSIQENHSGSEGSSGSITFNLSPAVKYDCSITITPNSGSNYATNGSDYSLGTTSKSVNAGVSSDAITITLIDDSVYETNSENYSLSVTAPTCGDSNTYTVTGSIAENSSEPTITITPSTSTVLENASDITVTISQSMARTVDYGVALGFTGGAQSCTTWSCSNPNDYIITGMAQCDGTDNGVWVCIKEGDTSTSITFNPTHDNVSEGDETATIEVTFPTDVSVSGSITISDPWGLESQTAFTDDGSTAHDAKQALTEYMNMSYWDDFVHTTSNANSFIHEFEQLNIHKVWSHKDSNGQYLDGTGEYIAIFDSGCDWFHKEFKTQRDANLVQSYGTHEHLEPEPSYNGTAWSNEGGAHCNAVAGVAAADYKATTGNDTEVMGVAYNAGLHFYDWDEFTGIKAAHYAEAINDARQYKPIAHNNSWGFTSIEYDDAQSGVNASSADNFWSTVFNGGTSSDQISAWQSYVQALDSFQEGDGDGVNGGVIVFAAGNENTESEVSGLAALPLFYSDLREAWIVATYFDNNETHTRTDNWDGSFSSGNITLMGNPCGSAKEFCVSLDAHGLNTVGARVGSTDRYATDYWQNAANNYVNSGSDLNLARLTGGSSYATPMVSGGLALLAQAFPNHTASQLTDRVLASANNSWFTASGSTTFTTNGASIKHGYHDTWGHGVPDFYAALQPITSSMNPTSSLGIPTKSKLGSTEDKLSLLNTSLSFSNVFGASIESDIKDETLYFYDALNGGFKIMLAGLVSGNQSDQTRLNLENDINNLQFGLSEIYKTPRRTYHNLNFLFNRTSFNFNTQSNAVKKFNDSKNLNVKSLNNSSDYFTSDIDKGFTFNHETKILGQDATFGYQNTSIQTEQFKKDEKIQNLSLAFSGGNSLIDNYVLISGLTLEEDSLLKSKGSSAFSLNNTETISKYLGVSINKILYDFTLGLDGTFGYTSIHNLKPSLITDISNIYSSSYSIRFKINELIKKSDSLSFIIQKPFTVNKGNINLKLPGLADHNGTVNYRDLSIDLSNNHNQLIYGLDYRYIPSERLAFGFKSIFQNENSHINQKEQIYSLSIFAKIKL